MDTHLRASVLDAALLLGVGTNATLTSWVFNSIQEDEEQEEQQPTTSLSPPTPTPPRPPPPVLPPSLPTYLPKPILVDRGYETDVPTSKPRLPSPIPLIPNTPSKPKKTRSFFRLPTKSSKSTPTTPTKQKSPPVLALPPMPAPIILPHPRVVSPPLSLGSSSLSRNGTNTSVSTTSSSSDHSTKSSRRRGLQFSPHQDNASSTGHSSSGHRSPYSPVVGPRSDPFPPSPFLQRVPYQDQNAPRRRSPEPFTARKPSPSPATPLRRSPERVVPLLRTPAPPTRILYPKTPPEPLAQPNRMPIITPTPRKRVPYPLNIPPVAPPTSIIPDPLPAPELIIPPPSPSSTIIPSSAFIVPSPRSSYLANYDIPPPSPPPTGPLPPPPTATHLHPGMRSRSTTPNPSRSSPLRPPRSTPPPPLSAPPIRRAQPFLSPMAGVPLPPTPNSAPVGPVLGRARSVPRSGSEDEREGTRIVIRGREGPFPARPVRAWPPTAPTTPTNIRTRVVQQLAPPPGPPPLPPPGVVQMTVPGLRERVLRDRDRGRAGGVSKIPQLIVRPEESDESDVSDYDSDSDEDEDEKEKERGNGRHDEDEHDDDDEDEDDEQERGMADVLDVLGRFADFGAVRRAAGGVPVDVRGSADSNAGWFGGADDLRGEIEARLNRSESVTSRVSVKRGRTPVAARI